MLDVPSTSNLLGVVHAGGKSLQDRLRHVWTY